MNYASVCSGAEAFGPAWHELGFKPVFHAEIEPHASAVLRYHNPTVPNYGDFTQIGLPGGPQPTEKVDLLCGGTPCQSFSVAGLREGLESEKGNLTLEFVKLAQRLNPRYILWENVPGVLSSNNGKDFACFLDALEEIGYICDVEILDLQFFGVPQRRKRVFVCAQSREDLLSQRTTTSALTICQCLLEIWGSILDEAFSKFVSGPTNSELRAQRENGLRRRMKLFGIATGKCSFNKWRQLLIEVFQKLPPVPESSDFQLGAYPVKELTVEGRLMGFQGLAKPSTLTVESLNSALDDLYEVMKSCITSTAIKATTPIQTYTCSRAGVLIGQLICRLSGSSPASLSAVSSFLTLSQKVTSYAEQSSRDIFEQLGGIHSWHDILAETRHTENFVRDSGNRATAAAVLFESESLRGNPAPRREAGQDVTVTLSSRTNAGGGLGTDFDCAGGLVPTAAYGGGNTSGEIKVATCLTTGNQRLDFDTETFLLEPAIAFTTEQTPKFNTEQALTLTKQSPTGGGQIQSVMQPATPINTQLGLRGPDSANSSREGVGLGNAGDPAFTLQANHGHAVQFGSAVRRLIPVECEALMGWQRDWTRYGINAKGKQYELADGPRYRICGNGWGQPVVTWIAKRILMVDALLAK